jgi:hypothetical protein
MDDRAIRIECLELAVRCYTSAKGIGMPVVTLSDVFYEWVMGVKT